jgi:hypothetical protein
MICKLHRVYTFFMLLYRSWPSADHDRPWKSSRSFDQVVSSGDPRVNHGPAVKFSTLLMCECLAHYVYTIDCKIV